MDLSLEREARKAEFLRVAGLAGARREPFAGDASTRSFERLHLPDGSTRFFMDQPPAPTNGRSKRRRSMPRW